LWGLGEHCRPDLEPRLGLDADPLHQLAGRHDGIDEIDRLAGKDDCGVDIALDHRLPVGWRFRLQRRLQFVFPAVPLREEAVADAAR
jgi:hypothetical protein